MKKNNNLYSAEGNRQNLIEKFFFVFKNDEETVLISYCCINNKKSYLFSYSWCSAQ